MTSELAERPTVHTAATMRSINRASALMALARNPGVTVELISDVATDDRLFTTAAGDRWPLPNAICEQVIALAESKGWSELFGPDQQAFSRSGQHLIGYTSSGSLGCCPTLRTSALVHRIRNWAPPSARRGFSVIREPFFSDESFSPRVGRGLVAESLGRARAESNLTGDEPDLAVIPVIPSSSALLDESLIFALQGWNPVAIDRFACEPSAPDPLRSLYETFVRGCSLLADRGVFACFGVTYEHPFRNLLNVLSDLANRQCYLEVGRREAQGRDNSLHKLLVYTKVTAVAAQATNWDTVRARLRASRHVAIEG